jgi:hypothetical protein
MKRDRQRLTMAGYRQPVVGGNPGQERPDLGFRHVPGMATVMETQ